MLHESSAPPLPVHLAPCTPERTAALVPRYEQIHQSLPEVEVDENGAWRARRAVERMLAIGRGERQ